MIRFNKDINVEYSRPHEGARHLSPLFTFYPRETLISEIAQETWESVLREI